MPPSPVPPLDMDVEIEGPTKILVEKTASDNARPLKTSFCSTSSTYWDTEHDPSFCSLSKSPLSKPAPVPAHLILSGGLPLAPKKDGKPVQVKKPREVGLFDCFSWWLDKSGLPPRQPIKRRTSIVRVKVVKPNTASSEVVDVCVEGVPTLDELVEVGSLGAGAFGAVSLVECKYSRRTFALKAISKGLIAERRMQKAVLREKEALKRTTSAFTVHLYATYSQEDKLYFLMEAAMGGDLATVYARYGYEGSEPHCRFYVACVLQAMERLHECKVMYRDLKLENIVVDHRGYGKLCDFGLAACLKDSSDRAYTVCGTRGYMAPEVGSKAGYTVAVDWWCLGILLFELMVGEGPFSGQDYDALQAMKFQGITSVHSAHQGSDWMDLVSGLCQYLPEQRLPMLPGGVDRVKSHNWYEGFDWAGHRAQKMTPPHLPRVENREDLRNFDTSWINRPEEISYVSDGTGWDKNFGEEISVLPVSA